MHTDSTTVRASTGGSEEAVSKRYQHPLYKTGLNARPAALLRVKHCEDQTQKKKITKTSSAARGKGNNVATSQASHTQGRG